MGRSTDRTRKRARRRKQSGKSIVDNPWFDPKIALLTPTPVQRRDWERNRALMWEKWAELEKADRPSGSKHAPVAAIVIDWDNHLGPREQTLEAIEEYEELVGPAFKECKEHLIKLLNLSVD